MSFTPEDSPGRTMYDTYRLRPNCKWSNPDVEENPNGLNLKDFHSDMQKLVV